MEQNELVEWAKSGFSDFSIQDDVVLRQFLKKYLKPKEVIETSNDESEPEIFLRDVLQSGNLNITDMCISCYGKNTDIVSKHPFFIAGLCESCSENLKETVFVLGDDAKNICCIICAQPGNLIMCENQNCPKTYCTKCLKFLMGIQKYEQIMDVSKWLCFFCTSNPINDCNLEIQKNWEEKLLKLLDNNNHEILFSNFSKKRPLTVLSLFDGISTGKYVLDLLGISICHYYACEIDEKAISVSKARHGNTITYLGDVENLTPELIKTLGHIDLILGGSPCNDFSIANPERKDVYDTTSTGRYIMHFKSILDAARTINKNVFYFFENVASMKIKNKELISFCLKDKPARIDAVYFSPQRRPRYYWSNIPGVHGLAQYWNLSPTEALETHTLSEYLMPYFERQATVKKIRTVTCQQNSLVQANNLMPVIQKGKPDKLWIIELEKVFGFPMHYTDALNLSFRQRLGLLGKSWSAQVVKTILQPLKMFFECK